MSLQTYRPATAPGRPIDAGQISQAEQQAALQAAEDLLRELEADPLARVRPAHIPPPRRDTAVGVAVLVTLRDGEQVELRAQCAADTDAAFDQWLAELHVQLTDARFSHGTFVRIGDQVLHTDEIRRIRRAGQSRLGQHAPSAHAAADVPAASRPTPHARNVGHPEPPPAPTPGRASQLDHADAVARQPERPPDPAAPAAHRRPAARRRAADAPDAPDADAADARRVDGPGARRRHAPDGAPRPPRSRRG